MTRPHHNLFAFISLVLLLVITCDVEPNENERSLSSKSLDQPTEEKSKAPGPQETEIPEDEEIVLKKLKEYRAKKQKQTAQSVETSTYHRSIDDLDQERKNFEAAQRAFREVCMFVAPLLFLSCEVFSQRRLPLVIACCSGGSKNCGRTVRQGRS
jgi:hypothetical protein